MPEPIGSIGEYHDQLLSRLYRDLEPHDPEGVLRHEWVNARGAIARFDRMSIEIRVLDIQETPQVDVAYVAVIVEILKLLCAEEWCDTPSLLGWRTETLAQLLDLAARQAETAEIGESRYLRALGFRGGSASLHELWEHLIDAASSRGTLDDVTGRMLEHYLRYGSLATSICKVLGPVPLRAAIGNVYAKLCEALAEGRPFAPPAAH